MTPITQRLAHFAHWSCLFALLALVSCSADDHGSRDSKTSGGAADGPAAATEPTGDPIVSLGDPKSPGATETNVSPVPCDDHAVCGTGSACVWLQTEEGGAPFSRCSFVPLAESTPCTSDAACSGFRCLELLPGLDAGTARICDGLPTTESSAGDEDD